MNVCYIGNGNQKHLWLIFFANEDFLGSVTSDLERKTYTSSLENSFDVIHNSHEKSLLHSIKTLRKIYIQETEKICLL